MSKDSFKWADWAVRNNPLRESKLEVAIARLDRLIGAAETHIHPLQGCEDVIWQAKELLKELETAALSAAHVKKDENS
jgi:hypothetical protein